MNKRILLWDLPVRIVHWSFVVLLAAMWWSGEEGDLELHRRLGLVFLGLLAFRLLWGLLGSESARFTGFVKGPGAVLAYIRKGAAANARPGHNPLGGWSVLVLLGLLALQIGLGLVAQDVDGLESGPLNHLVAYETADAAREWHEVIFNVILAVVAVHVGAIAYYLVVKRDNLVRPMLTGRREVPGHVAEPRRAGAVAFLACLAIAVALALWIGAGAPPLGSG